MAPWAHNKGCPHAGADGRWAVGQVSLGWDGAPEVPSSHWMLGLSDPLARDAHGGPAPLEPVGRSAMPRGTIPARRRRFICLGVPALDLHDSHFRLLCAAPCALARGGGRWGPPRLRRTRSRSAERCSQPSLSDVSDSVIYTASDAGAHRLWRHSNIYVFKRKNVKHPFLQLYSHIFTAC